MPSYAEVLSLPHLKFGSKNAGIILVKQYLVATGYLIKDTQLNAKFDQTLVDALKRSQKMRVLPTTGELDQQTRECISVPHLCF